MWSFEESKLNVILFPVLHSRDKALILRVLRSSSEKGCQDLNVSSEIQRPFLDYRLTKLRMEGLLESWTRGSINGKRRFMSEMINLEIE